MRYRFAAWLTASIWLINAAMAADHESGRAPKLVLSIIEEKEPASQRSVLVGHLSIINTLSSSLCLHKDLIENDSSPHKGIKINGKFGSGLPPPPRVAGTREIAPGENVSFRQIVSYRDSEKVQKRATIQVVVLAWRCDGSRRLKLLSNKVRL
jgi:hypothetical protein